MKSMDKKELILSEAEKLFAEKGYYGLGLSELLKRCSIPKGSFYYYFPDGKIQLIQEVLEYSYQRMRTRIAEWMMDEPTALSAFSRMADHLSRGVVEKRMLASMLLSMIAIESVYLDPQVNETCQRLYADWQQYYATCLNHFGVPAETCQAKAQAVFALIHGSLISSWIKHNPEDLQLAKISLKEILGQY
ncbi:MAG: TetR/AcrR family transcriptional regulator [Clostridia bacterium]|nr:TetR/AcrR family transcriptional regulator [Clostridia bacterium]